ncbi:MAG: ABC transporter ATP-binding protein [Oscillospiraceae bacterium]
MADVIEEKRGTWKLKDEIFFKTSDLTVGYDKKPLINDINISVKKGEILTLIGPNGSGKSTILKSITKHLEAIGGVVYIGNDDLFKMSGNESAKKMSVVLTDRITTEMMTCFDVVATGRYPYTNHFGKLTDEDTFIVKNALERVHALELEDRDFQAISDGQRQRIMLARAICQQPELIILDEPTSFLDIKHKIELLSILREMATSKDITVIMSLHEVDLASKISDKIMCVKGDYISAFGTPDEIFKDNVINELYEIENGSYNMIFGSVELVKPLGKPIAFVLGGDGKGFPVYRKLQKLNIPFATGILFENDIDFQVAKVLSDYVYTVKAFTSVDQQTYNKTLKAMLECDYVVDCGVETLEYNSFLADLISAAKQAGKTIKNYKDI